MIASFIIISYIHILTDFSVFSRECGVQDVQPIFNKFNYSRIIRGEDSVPNSWPWAVRINKLVYPYLKRDHCAG